MFVLVAIRGMLGNLDLMYFSISFKSCFSNIIFCHLKKNEVPESRKPHERRKRACLRSLNAHLSRLVRVRVIRSDVVLRFRG